MLFSVDLSENIQKFVKNYKFSLRFKRRYDFIREKNMLHIVCCYSRNVIVNSWFNPLNSLWFLDQESWFYGFVTYKYSRSRVTSVG